MPLYYTNGEERLFKYINNIADRLERDRVDRISMYTRVLIFNMISAIKEDPSPSWIATRDELDFQYAKIVKELPKLIQRFVKQAGQNRQLTFFEAMHWLSLNLDSICPFQKGNERRVMGG